MCSGSAAPGKSTVSRGNRGILMIESLCPRLASPSCTLRTQYRILFCSATRVPHCSLRAGPTLQLDRASAPPFANRFVNRLLLTPASPSPPASPASPAAHADFPSAARSPSRPPASASPPRASRLRQRLRCHKISRRVVRMIRQQLRELRQRCLRLARAPHTPSPARTAQMHSSDPAPESPSDFATLSMLLPITPPNLLSIPPFPITASLR